MIPAQPLMKGSAVTIDPPEREPEERDGERQKQAAHENERPLIGHRQAGQRHIEREERAADRSKDQALAMFRSRSRSSSHQSFATPGKQLGRGEHMARAIPRLIGRAANKHSS